MIDDCPSKTALRVAMHRAAHQVLDDPKVFDDPLALRILSAGNGTARPPDPKWMEETPSAGVLRASLAARSRFAEDKLHNAVKQGVHQYVVLGAGLDTFACRNPYPGNLLQVFEVDHPATQSWKRARLEEAGIPVPRSLTFAPVNFESGTLDEGLRQAGFDTGKPAFFSWLGVTPYLSKTAVVGILQLIASMPKGSGTVFDYMVPPSMLDPESRLAFDRLADRVASAGEPFRTFFDPASLRSRMRAMGFSKVEDLEPGKMNARYFRGRTDRLRVGTLANVMNARV